MPMDERFLKVYHRQSFVRAAAHTQGATRGKKERRNDGILRPRRVYP